MMEITIGIDVIICTSSKLECMGCGLDRLKEPLTFMSFKGISGLYFEGGRDSIIVSYTRILYCINLVFYSDYYGVRGSRCFSILEKAFLISVRAFLGPFISFLLPTS